MLILFLALLLASPISAYVSLYRHRKLALSRCATSQEINDVFLTSMFGRLTDNYLLLDIEGAGTPEMMNCCHSGCDNCDYARIFDNLTSGRPKWIPLYSYRKLIDGRDHSPLWMQLFETSGELTRDEFIAKIKQMPYSSCIGPPSIETDSITSDDTLRDDLLSLFYDIVSMKETKLSSQQFASNLKELGRQEHGLTWVDFRKIFV